MSIIDASLARTSGAATSVLGLAKDLSLDPATVEKAVMALAYARVSAGDTLSVAASRTGASTETLSKVSSAVGGDEALGEIADDLSAGLRGLGQGNFFKDALSFG